MALPFCCQACPSDHDKSRLDAICLYFTLVTFHDRCSLLCLASSSIKISHFSRCVQVTTLHGHKHTFSEGYVQTF